MSETFQSEDLPQLELKSEKALDDTSEKVLSNIREGGSPVNAILKELAENPNFISQDMNPLVLVFSSIFSPQAEYQNMIKEYTQKVLDPQDPLYTLLLISVNKSHELTESDLLPNWLRTFSIVILSLLNTEKNSKVDQKQILLYFDKLGSALFKTNRSPQER